MNRRGFLVQGGCAMATLTASAPLSAREPVPAIGLGLFTLPKLLDQDFTGTLKLLARLGYREVEPFGPYAFSDPRAIAGWKTATPSLGFAGSGFFGRSPAEAGAAFRANGIRAPSLHTDLDTLVGRMGALAEAAHAVGARYVTLPAIPPGLRRTIDDYRRVADTFNAIGASAASHGVAFTYHNHGYGLKPQGDVIPFELLLANTDPSRVFLEMDIFWTTAGGIDPVDYLTRFAGRYKLMHLKDMKRLVTFAGDGSSPDQWYPLLTEMTPLGDGALNLPAILATARRTGVRHFFIEQDLVADPQVALKRSADYLKKHGFGG